MKKINLRDVYPDIYKVDIFLEVNDEVQEVFLKDKREKQAYERQMYRYKAQYSLDYQNGIETAVLEHSRTPEEILEDKQWREKIYAAVMNLSKKQAQRIYSRYYLGMSTQEIAQAEEVSPRRVRDSIYLGLKKLKESLK